MPNKGFLAPGIVHPSPWRRSSRLASRPEILHKTYGARDHAPAPNHLELREKLPSSLARREFSGKKFLPPIGQRVQRGKVYWRRNLSNRNQVNRRNSASLKSETLREKNDPFKSPTQSGSLPVQQAEPSNVKSSAEASVVPPNSSSSSCGDDGSKKGQYEKLMLSLLSPLPNEHQLALEVLLRLSAMDDLPDSLNVIENTPGLLPVLLAHAGIYDSCDLRTIFEECRKDAFGDRIDFERFWLHILYTSNEADEDYDRAMEHVRLKGQLICECFQGGFLKLQLTPVGVVKVIDSEPVEESDQAKTSKKCCVGCCVQFDENNENKHPGAVSAPSASPNEHGFDIDRITARIQQVGQVLRNFSMAKGNAATMLKSRALLRFLLLAVQSQYSTFTSFAYDMLGSMFKTWSTSSVSIQVECDSTLLHMYGMIWDLVTTTLMKSTVRLKIAGSMETISGLATLKSPRIVLTSGLLLKICTKLAKDPEVIVKLLCLECIYAVTRRNEQGCELLLNVPHSLKLLVAFLACTDKVGVPSYNIVTRSIRFLVALILKQVTKTSKKARVALKPFETRIAVALMSGDEPSGALAHCLYDITSENSQDLI